jgi:hypothetical protein
MGSSGLNDAGSAAAAAAAASDFYSTGESVGSFADWMKSADSSSSSSRPGFIAGPSSAGYSSAYVMPGSGGSSSSSGITSSLHQGHSSSIGSSVMFDNGWNEDYPATGPSSQFGVSSSTISSSNPHKVAANGMSTPSNDWTGGASSTYNSNVSSDRVESGHKPGGSSSSSSSGNGMLFSNPAVAAAELIDDLSGAAGNVADAASGVANGVAATVAAGIDWLGTAAAAGSSSNGSSSSSSSGTIGTTAVVPDVIIERQDSWPAVTAAGQSSFYRPWQQQGYYYVQPFVEQRSGFPGPGATGFYQQNYGVGGYGSSNFAAAPAAADQPWHYDPTSAAAAAPGPFGTGDFMGAAASGSTSGFVTYGGSGMPNAPPNMTPTFSSQGYYGSSSGGNTGMHAQAGTPYGFSSRTVEAGSNSAGPASNMVASSGTDSSSVDN